MPSLIARTPVKVPSLTTSEEENRTQRHSSSSSSLGLTTTNSNTRNSSSSNRNHVTPITPVPLRHTATPYQRLSFGNEFNSRSSLSLDGSSIPRNIRIPFSLISSSQESYTNSQPHFYPRSRSSNIFNSRLSLAPLSLSSSQSMNGDYPAPFSPSTSAPTINFSLMSGSHLFPSSNSTHPVHSTSNATLSTASSSSSSLSSTSANLPSNAGSSTIPLTSSNSKSNMTPLSGLPFTSSSILSFSNHPHTLSSTRTSLGGHASSISSSTSLYNSNFILNKLGALDCFDSFAEFKIKVMDPFREYLSKTLEQSMFSIRKEYLSHKAVMVQDKDTILSLKRKQASLKSKKVSAQTLLQKQSGEREKQSNQIFQLKEKLHEFKEKVNATQSVVQQDKHQLHQLQMQLKNQQVTRLKMQKAAQREIQLYITLLGLKIVPGTHQVLFNFEFPHSNQGQLILSFPLLSPHSFPEVKQCSPWIPFDEYYKEFQGSQDLFLFLKQIRSEFLQHFSAQKQQQRRRTVTTLS
ncbi:hypothetical protein HMI54_012483 [Coelomomyces lativittatus]|nr:hypothetical protein HMI56_007135 [Coelomomyces lativittatus]KAJ1515366.1 hypothetical protein HMI54_012483 [Coelomomyces lativittatus]KAJ1516272.1 hypothetical protein HMI55_002657 [Coelomomyces lativittatus]